MFWSQPNPWANSIGWPSDGPDMRTLWRSVTSIPRTYPAPGPGTAGRARSRASVDQIDVALFGLDLPPVLLEGDGDAVTDEILVGDGAALALEVTFGDDDLVALLEPRHGGIIAPGRSGRSLERQVVHDLAVVEPAPAPVVHAVDQPHRRPVVGQHVRVEGAHAPLAGETGELLGEA